MLIRNADWIVVVGGIITLLGTVMLNIKANRESDANKIEQGKILEQSLKVNNLITGGDSYPLVVFSDVDFQFGTSQWSVVNQGNYPLSIVQVTVSDNSEIQKVLSNPKNMTEKGIPEDLLTPYMKNASLSEIMVGSAVRMNTFPFQFREGCSYSINILARNGNFNQVLYTHKTKDRWLVAWRLTKSPSNTILKDFIPEEFPKELLKW